MPQPTPDEALAAIARPQAGVFTRAQAGEAGFDVATIERRLRTRAWVPQLPQVYRATTTPVTASVQAVAARLWCGSAAMFGHTSAARLHRIEIWPRDRRVWLTVPFTTAARARSGIVVVRSRRLPSPTTAFGQPVTPVERTVVDLSRVLSADGMRRVLHDVVRAGVSDLDLLAAELDSSGPKPGTGMLRRVLAEFDPAFELEVERRAHDLLAAEGVLLTPQYELYDGWLLLARFDLADEELLIDFEIDGPSHETREGIDRDRRRDRAVGSRGWRVSRHGFLEVMKRERQFVSDVMMRRRAVFSERGARRRRLAEPSV